MFLLKQARKSATISRLTLLALFFLTPSYGTAAAGVQDHKTYHIALYRGQAGCSGCSEMVYKSLMKTGLPLDITYVGEAEKLKVNEQTLRRFDIYVQPGGGQDIPASYEALSDEGAEAVRNFVKSGKGFIGLCMGAYLAGKDWIGLVDTSMESEVGRPGSRAYDQGDYTLQIDWNNKREPFYYQDGPYMENGDPSDGFKAIAYYENGDIAMARYKYGKGTVLLSGPHPEADETWIDSTMSGNTTAESKMVRILSYFDIKK